jgi:hypothetical protein
MQDDLPARQRSHQDGARAPRPQRPLVSPAQDQKAPQVLSHSPRGRRRARDRPMGRNAGDLHEFTLAERSIASAKTSTFIRRRARNTPLMAGARVGVAGLPTPRKAGRYVAAGKNGLPPRSRSTIGTSSPTTRTIRPSTACAASWHAPSKATRSTRSQTTSACPARTSSATCASRIRCRSRPKGKSGFGWSRTRTRPRTFGRLYHRCQTPDLENSLATSENFRKKRCKISYFGGEWCNGSTTDSDSVCLGSNPSSPATTNPSNIFRPFPKLCAFQRFGE